MTTAQGPIVAGLVVLDLAPSPHSTQRGGLCLANLVLGLKLDLLYALLVGPARPSFSGLAFSNWPHPGAAPTVGFCDNFRMGLCY
ncbi:MAG: hypothetical protein ACKO7W_06495 [Elainella sp.]